MDGLLTLAYAPRVSRAQRFQVRVGDREHEVRIDAGPPRRIFVDDVEHTVLPTPKGTTLVRAPDSAAQIGVTLDDPRNPHQAVVRGQRVTLTVETAEAAALAAALSDVSGGGNDGGKIEAPMPGRVVKVLVRVGDEIKEGAPAVIVEAMKMENELHAPLSGTVVKVEVAQGDVVEVGKTLCVIEAHDDSP